MPAPAHLSLPAPCAPVPGPTAAPDDAPFCVFSAEGAHTETPLTSEPPLPAAEPLTSEPPLTEQGALTSESDASADPIGPVR
ncbi:hypothetical protein ACIQGO_04125 [Streptomyces shenzhenensis]|uniref:hypothetical protein n=1 Tax=Streptomyces shenzhenensis TaxID=943815 RepID=UPI00382BBEB9